MRKFLCVILIISILSYSICIYAENDQLNNTETSQENQSEQKTEENETKTLEQLQADAEEINKQIAENAEKLQLVEDEVSQNLIEVQGIDSKIQVSELELNKLDEDVELLNKDIISVEEELNIKQVQYEKINRQAEKAIVAMYEGGNIQYLDVLLGSKNIIDFVSNYFLVSEIIHYNIDLIEEASAQKQKVEEIAQKLQEQKDEITEKKKQQQRIRQVLENTKASREYYISKLSDEEKKIQEAIDEYRLQMAEVEVEIRKLAGIKSFGEDYIGESMIWPVPGHTVITSPYGMRTHPITGLYSLHTGTDISATIGTEFLAAASGVVTKAEYNKYYGNMVLIDHGGGVQTLYAHGSEIVVKLGDLVAQGDVVLKVGSTGYSTGPHAHFEIRIDGETVNPLDYVKPQ